MSQIKVTITDNRSSEVVESGSSLTNTTSTAVNSKGVLNQKEAKQNGKSSQSLAVASMISQQAFNYMTSNVGKWTGSTQKQNQVNNAMQLIGIGAMAYVSPALAIANVGINLATTAMDTAYEQRWDRYAKDNARKRAGEVKGRGR